MSYAHTSKKNITTTKDNYVEITINPLVVLVVILLAIISFYFYKNSHANGLDVGKRNDSLAENVDTSDVAGPVFSAKIGNSPVMGRASAPVTIFEFSDFECPFCRAFYYGIPKRVEPAWEQIKKNYIDTGKAKYVAKSFVAVPGHNPAAQKEAQAAYCAHKQGKYFEYAHELFKVAGRGGAGANGSFEKGGEAALKKELIGLAKNLGLDTGKFSACLDSEESLTLYKADEQFVQTVISKEAAAAGEQGLGTPMFIICKTPKDNNTVCKGKVLMGAYPYRYFKTLIDDLLKGNSN